MIDFNRAWLLLDIIAKAVHVGADAEHVLKAAQQELRTLHLIPPPPEPEPELPLDTKTK